ncbi:MAG TPA: hypothetical protein VFI73_12900 [Candidatus Nitrosopolaris sp.]|nr:hypothetical protein [Candidatus Nitrosopolaris sp.]
MAQSIEDKKKDKEQDLQLIDRVLKEMTEVQDSVQISVKKFLEEIKE